VTTVTRGARSVRALSPALVTSIGIEICRYALIVVISLIGLSKFTSGEAAAIAPLVLHSPFLAWTAIFGSQATSDAIGSVELLIVVLLLARPLSARAAALGAALAVGTFLTTSSFLLTTPHVFTFNNGLAILSDVGAFLIKDLGLLGASIVVLGEALTAVPSNEHGQD
jgi:reactive chlorine resistance protein C